MLLTHDHYRPFLKSVLAERAQRNPSYSMSAFAQQLGMTHSGLSQVLSGKRNLSEASALRIAQRLRLDEKETEYLSLLVRANDAKDILTREAALKGIERIRPRARAADMSVEYFRLIADWYHFAVRNSLDIAGLEHTPRAIARRLGITAVEAEVALDRLMKLALIEPDPGRPGRLRKVVDSTVVRSSSPNEALRSFHRQMLQKAIGSLETQLPSEKFIGSETLAVDRADLGKAAAIAEEFFTSMNALAASARKKTDVYHLSVQFFNLTPRKLARTEA